AGRAADRGLRSHPPGDGACDRPLAAARARLRVDDRPAARRLLRPARDAARGGARDAARCDRARQGPGRGRRAGRAVREGRLGLAPAAENQAAEREAETEGADGEGADRDRLAPGREPGPAAERFLVFRGQRLAATLLAQRAARPQPEVEVVEDLGRLIGHFAQCIAWVRRCPCGSFTSPTCTPEAWKRLPSSGVWSRLWSGFSPS